MHKRYKLCDPCQQLIREIEEKQREILRFRQINKKLEESQLEKRAPKLLSISGFCVKGFLYCLNHLLAAVFINYCKYFCKLMKWNSKDLTFVVLWFLNPTSQYTQLL
jgi:hypothetical protein